MKRSLGPESAPLSSLKCTPLFSVPRTEGFSVQTPQQAFPRAKRQLAFKNSQMCSSSFALPDAAGKSVCLGY